MHYWIFMIIIILIIPITMVGFGNRFMKKPPKKINRIYGYRTYMSMINQQTWEFAHIYCGKLCHKIGRILMLLILSMFFVLGEDEYIIGNLVIVLLGIQITSLIVIIILTEKKLRQKFDKNGNILK